jgi:hypothetical protein
VAAIPERSHRHQAPKQLKPVQKQKQKEEIYQEKKRNLHNQIVNITSAYHDLGIE